jgi:Flp pilus assembly protein TadD
MTNPLRELDSRARDATLAGRWHEAVALYEALLEKQPNWEHGYGHLHLADCYEHVGQLDGARATYKAGLRLSPNDPILLGNYASFLYLHGDPEEAFVAHLNLLSVESDGQAQVTMEALNSLGQKLGLTQEVIAARIAAECRRRS